MCGIYATNFVNDESEVKSRLEQIKFRGPDDTGIKTIDEVTFGHLRLSIVDLENRSNQPMLFAQLMIVFNGEIYNYLSIKSELIAMGYQFDTTSDTEVLLKGFDAWGEKLVPKLNGMFAFVIYDKDKKTLFCSRDRLGVKPFYYHFKDGYFEICSQLRPMVSRANINKEAISMYLDCTYIPSPYSIYEDIQKLSPGHNLEIDLKTNELKLTKYWDLTEVQLSAYSYEQAKDHLHELLKDAVKIRLMSDVPYGSFLSGGIDSALISSIATKVSPEQIKTFSIGFEDPEFDESRIAAQYAAIIKSAHTEITCTAADILEMIPTLIKVYDEPFADSSALPSLLLNKMTKGYVTMALSGDGGDESFLGYNHFDWVSIFNKITKIPYALRYLGSFLFIKNIFGKRTASFKRILQTKSKDDFIYGIFLGYNSLLKKRDTTWLKHYSKSLEYSNDSFQKAADLNIKLWLENDSNVKVDRASMAYSVEVRSPFLDYRIIEFARTLPISFRYLPGRKKRILRDILKEYIPEAVFDHPKRGFAVPIGKWIREELRTEFEDSLTDDFLNQVPNLDVAKFKKMFKDHLNGKYDYSSYIWRLYILSKWYQEFGFYNKGK